LDSCSKCLSLSPSIFVSHVILTFRLSRGTQSSRFIGERNARSGTTLLPWRKSITDCICFYTIKLCLYDRCLIHWRTMKLQFQEEVILQRDKSQFDRRWNLFTICAMQGKNVVVRNVIPTSRKESTVLSSSRHFLTKNSSSCLTKLVNFFTTWAKILWRYCTYLREKIFCEFTGGFSGWYDGMRALQKIGELTRIN